MMTPLPGISKDVIIAELRSEACRCGNKKGRGKTFCFRCFQALPEKLQNLLYEPRGYTDTYREACAELYRQKQKS